MYQIKIVAGRIEVISLTLINVELGFGIINFFLSTKQI